MRKLGVALVAVTFLASTGCYATIRGPGRPESRQGEERQHERDRGHDRDRGDEHARGDQGERNHDLTRITSPSTSSPRLSAVTP